MGVFEEMLGVRYECVMSSSAQPQLLPMVWSQCMLREGEESGLRWWDDVLMSMMPRVMCELSSAPGRG